MIDATFSRTAWGFASAKPSTRRLQSISLRGVNSFLAREPETMILVSSESMPTRLLASSDRVLHERSHAAPMFNHLAPACASNSAIAAFGEFMDVTNLYYASSGSAVQPSGGFCANVASAPPYRASLASNSYFPEPTSNTALPFSPGADFTPGERGAGRPPSVTEPGAEVGT